MFAEMVECLQWPPKSNERSLSWIYCNWLNRRWWHVVFILIFKALQQKCCHFHPDKWHKTQCHKSQLRSLRCLVNLQYINALFHFWPYWPAHLWYWLLFVINVFALFISVFYLSSPYQQEAPPFEPGPAQEFFLLKGAFASLFGGQVLGFSKRQFWLSQTPYKWMKELD